MTRPTKILRWATAAATVLLLSALAVQCIDLYLTGRTHAFSTFTREIVAERLGLFTWPALLWAALAMAAGLTSRGEPTPLPLRRPDVSQKAPDSRWPVGATRIALYAAAALLTILGVMNGGLRDVLVKAINICTECIGLG